MGFFDDANNKSALNSKLNKLNASIKDNCSELGTRYYNLYKDDPDPKLKELVDEITSAYLEINDIEAQLAFLRGVVICPNCKKECSSNLRFCTSCGTQLIKPVEPALAVQPQYAQQTYAQNPYTKPYQAQQYQQTQYQTPQNPYQPYTEPAQPIQPVQTDIYAAPAVPVVPTKPEEQSDIVNDIQPTVEAAVNEAQDVHITEPEAQAAESPITAVAETPVAPVTNEAAVQYKFCTQCGTKMQSTARFCTQCGNRFNA